MSGVTVLPCPPSFYEGYIPQLSGLLTRCIEAGAELGFVTPVSPRETHAHWMRFYSNVMMKQSVVFLALDELTQGLLGCVVLTLAWQPNAPHRADVLKLLVDPSARGRGISTLLMNILEDYARSLGRTLLTRNKEVMLRRYIRNGVGLRLAIYPTLPTPSINLP